MKTAIRIGNERVNVEFLNNDDFIYVVKHVGSKTNYTLICAKKNAKHSDLCRKVYLKNSDYWLKVVNDCEFKCTDIPAFSQCLNPREYNSKLVLNSFSF